MKESNNTFLVTIDCITFNHAAYIKGTMDGFCMQQTTFPFVSTIVDDTSSLTRSPRNTSRLWVSAFSTSFGVSIIRANTGKYSGQYLENVLLQN